MGKNLFRKGAGLYEGKRRLLLFWLAAGWIGAAVWANQAFASGLVSSQVLFDGVCQGWRQLAQGKGKAAAWVAGVRLLQLAAVGLLCRGGARRMLFRFLLLLTAASASCSLVLFTWCRGPWGIVWFACAGFPQGVCYLGALAALTASWELGFLTRAGRLWGLVIALTAFGILAEIKLCPLLMQLFPSV